MRALTVRSLVCGALLAVGLYAQGQQPPKTHLKEGDMAPDFTLYCHRRWQRETERFPRQEHRCPGLFPGRVHRWLNEGNAAYQAGIAKFKAMETKVFGISTDNTPSQKEFATKNNIKVPMLSDFTKREVSNALWGADRRRGNGEPRHVRGR